MITIIVSAGIEAVPVAIAAFSFVWGVSAWKREFIGKRRVELAQSVLSLFYEAETAIQDIRNPCSFGDEEKAITPAENDREECVRLRESANVVFDRYQKREKLFAELRSMKYQIMATFGKTYGEPFDEISKVLNKIFWSARMLGTKYWPTQNLPSMNKHLSDKQFKEHLSEMHRHETVFWSLNEDGDEISFIVSQAVNKIESLAKDARK